VIFVLRSIKLWLLKIKMISFPDISPEIFSINFLGVDFALRWYAVSYIMGFIIALYIMKIFVSRKLLWSTNGPPLEADQADSLLTYLILGVIIGGRLGYVVFYNFDYYLINPFAIFRIWDGGMAFHGGFIGVVIAVIAFCRFNAAPIGSTADLIALSTPPGLFFGRVANFINAELWGRPTTVPWGVVFPGDLAQQCDGVVGPCARHPSQLYEAGLEGILLFFILLSISFSGGLKKPGFVTGIFLIVYGFSRFLVEYFRVPDPQFLSTTNPYGFAFKLGDFGFTMGQSLSLPMIFVGLALCIYWIKHKQFEQQ